MYFALTIDRAGLNEGFHLLLPTSHCFKNIKYELLSSSLIALSRRSVYLTLFFFLYAFLCAALLEASSETKCCQLLDCFSLYTNTRKQKSSRLKYTGREANKQNDLNGD